MYTEGRRALKEEEEREVTLSEVASAALKEERHAVSTARADAQVVMHLYEVAYACA